MFGCMLAQASPAIVESETTLMFADSAFDLAVFHLGGFGYNQIKPKINSMCGNGSTE